MRFSLLSKLNWLLISLLTMAMLAYAQSSYCLRASTQSAPAVSIIIDIPQIIGRAPADVEKTVGKPKNKTKITNTPEQMPGEFRDYEIKGAQLALTVYGMMVRYHVGRAVHVTVDLPEPAESADEALRMAGIDVGTAEPRVRAPRAERWAGRFNGVEFKDVAALKMGRDSSRYSSVQATLAQ